MASAKGLLLLGLGEGFVKFGEGCLAWEMVLWEVRPAITIMPMLTSIAMPITKGIIGRGFLVTVMVGVSGTGGGEGNKDEAVSSIVFRVASYRWGVNALI